MAASKLLSLELLRFASAIAVLFFHYSHFGRMEGMTRPLRADIPFYSWLWPLYDYGQFGVQVFWAISGYIFFWKYGDAIRSGSISAGRFAWLRFSRLYPLHFITLMSVVLLQISHRHLTGADFIYQSQDVGTFVRQLFMATHWGARNDFTFNGPIWSVSAEVAVYAGFFIILRRFAPSLALCLTVIILSIALQSMGVDSVPLACAAYFFSGAIAATIPSDGKKRMAAAVLMTAILLISASTGALADRTSLRALLIVTLPLLLIATVGEWRALDRWHRPITAAGNLTYSTYLLHFPLQIMLAIAVAATGAKPDLTSPAFLFAYLGVSLAIGVVSYRWLEMPAQSWLRNLDRK